MRKKGPIWNHFTIESKDYNSHPHVRCNYCSKDFQRAVPERMQAHVDKKCSKAPSNVKQQNTMISITDNNGFHMSEKEQSSLESLLTKKLSSSEVLLSFVNNPVIIQFFQHLCPTVKLPNKNVANMPIDEIDDSDDGRKSEFYYQNEIRTEEIEIQSN
ncbi:unnamed protein product [Rhizophagus irregularis]|nr:unnamed protein product [Rhizophagus irregularis]